MDKNLVSKIEKNYDFLVKDLNLLREGPDNNVFVLQAENGQKYIIRLSKRNVLDDIVFELSFMDFLAHHNIPVPGIIRTKAGKLFDSIDGSVIVIFEFIDGYHIEVGRYKKPSLDAVAQAARMLAKIHNVSKGFGTKTNRKRNIFTEIERSLEVKDILIDNFRGGDKFVEEIEAYNNWAKDNYVDEITIQNDFRSGNIFFHDSTVKAVIDFDWACKGLAIKDLALALVEWSYPSGAKEYWKDVFKSFLDHYNEVADEKVKLDNNLYKWICFSCLSDASTYFCDLISEGVFKKINSSYMYQKCLYFRKLDNENLLL